MYTQVQAWVCCTQRTHKILTSYGTSHSAHCGISWVEDSVYVRRSAHKAHWIMGRDLCDVGSTPPDLPSSVPTLQTWGKPSRPPSSLLPCWSWSVSGLPVEDIRKHSVILFFLRIVNASVDWKGWSLSMRNSHGKIPVCQPVVYSS